MGKLLNGRWVNSTEQTRIGESGEFVRGVTTFRDAIEPDPIAKHPAESGRYHLLVADNCPWAHRAVVVRNLKGLTEHVGMSVAHYRRNDDGWWFATGLDDFRPTSGQLPLHVFYSNADGQYSGSATVPVLWDRKLKTIVSNESSEIIVMLNHAFEDVVRIAGGAPTIDLYPAADRAAIDAVNEWIYSQINNGVYKCGFARTQEAYDSAFLALFEGLDRVEQLLGKTRYLVGETVSLADVRLFTTLARFDAVYFGHFKCNQRRVVDYPNLWPYLRDLYQIPGFGETVKLDIYKQGYYGRSPGINPRGIVPLGPAIDFTTAHGRG